MPWSSRGVCSGCSGRKTGSPTCFDLFLSVVEHQTSSGEYFRRPAAGKQNERRLHRPSNFHKHWWLHGFLVVW